MDLEETDTVDGVELPGADLSGADLSGEEFNHGAVRSRVGSAL
ncbi:hypothetical protein [Arthrobacter sp. I3]|nr:hypothetical protein [Arthrobacter sp. I3]